MEVINESLTMMQSRMAQIAQIAQTGKLSQPPQQQQQVKSTQKEPGKGGKGRPRLFDISSYESRAHIVPTACSSKDRAKYKIKRFLCRHCGRLLSSRSSLWGSHLRQCSERTIPLPSWAVVDEIENPEELKNHIRRTNFSVVENQSIICIHCKQNIYRGYPETREQYAKHVRACLKRKSGQTQTFSPAESVHTDGEATSPPDIQKLRPSTEARCQHCRVYFMKCSRVVSPNVSDSSYTPCESCLKLNIPCYISTNPQTIPTYNPTMSGLRMVRFQNDIAPSNFPNYGFWSRDIGTHFAGFPRLISENAESSLLPEFVEPDSIFGRRQQRNPTFEKSIPISNPPLQSSSASLLQSRPSIPLLFPLTSPTATVTTAISDDESPQQSPSPQKPSLPSAKKIRIKRTYTKKLARYIPVLPRLYKSTAITTTTVNTETRRREHVVHRVIRKRWIGSAVRRDFGVLVIERDVSARHLSVLRALRTRVLARVEEAQGFSRAVEREIGGESGVVRRASDKVLRRRGVYMFGTISKKWQKVVRGVCGVAGKYSSKQNRREQVQDDGVRLGSDDDDDYCGSESDDDGFGVEEEK
ncbi:hypothetical protein HK100_006469 [Physocladia obscura]|uniref:Uncharacterized protein n=1 Tax=Physocladia obscura TaxID=109957 RepID=A0AAD5T9M5_9FUNG|nr:hypothetical protein HK100_006469 [Physocladia obscura]